MPVKAFISFKDFIHELFTKEVKVLLVLLLLFSAALAFISVGNLVSAGSTRNFDISIIESFRDKNDLSKPIGSQWLLDFMTDVTSLGSATVLTFITIFVSVFLLLQKKYDAFLLLVLATIGGALISVLLKEIYSRERPDLIFRLATVSSLSFPSGHSMMSAVFYLTQAAIVARFQRERKIRIYILSIAIFLTLIIGISRVFLGVHYPTDVLGGWTIGFAWASFCWVIAWYIQRRKRLRNLREENQS